jgi:hypothetical protein
LIQDDKEDLTPVRQMYVARIVLKIGVGHERRDAVEDSGWSKHAKAPRIERRDRLHG